MKISLDTSIIIEIERKKEETIELVENLLNKIFTQDEAGRIV